MDDQIIKANIDRILCLSQDEGEKYPELASLFKRTDIVKKLRHMLEYAQNHPIPRMTYKDGTEFWTIPVSYLMEHHGSCAQTWQSNIIFMVVSGLVNRVRPTSKSKLKELREEYARATQYRERPESFYSFPEYTDELLQKAEQTAALWKQHGCKIGHVAKTDIILLYGKKYANELYCDSRTVSAEELWMRKELKKVMLKQIKKSGYTTKHHLYGYCYKSFGLDQFERSESIYRLFKKYENRLNILCKEAGCEYRQATKKDR